MITIVDNKHKRRGDDAMVLAYLVVHVAAAVRGDRSIDRSDEDDGCRAVGTWGNGRKQTLLVRVVMW
jgi:hypothetical protein